MNEIIFVSTPLVEKIFSDFCQNDKKKHFVRVRGGNNNFFFNLYY